MVCAGWIGERMLRVRVTELARGAQAADAEAFAAGITRAARGG
jgi:hypothetical protein